MELEEDAARGCFLLIAYPIAWLIALFVIFALLKTYKVTVEHGDSKTEIYLENK